MGIDNPVHLLFLAVVALLVLGPRRLPELARSLGKGIREFRESVNGESLGEGGPAAAPETADADATRPVDPARPVRSGDAPDRRPL